MKKYIRKEVAEIVGLPDRRLEFYTNQNLLYQGSWRVGKGKHRKYSQQNIFELLVVKRLSENGMSLEKIKRILIKLGSYFLQKRLFTESGDVEKEKISFIITGEQRLFLIVYDIGRSVHLLIEGSKFFQSSRGKLSFFSMQGHESALIIDLTPEIKSMHLL